MEGGLSVPDARRGDKAWPRVLSSIPRMLGSFLKDLIRGTPLHPPLSSLAWRRRLRAEVEEWKLAGRPVPPPHLVKEQTLVDYAQRWGLKTLVETGTYRGDMVQAMLNRFDRIYSIELDADLYAACDRFRGRPDVELIHGDSGLEVARIVRRLDTPALFWLDAHYSAGVTAKGELNTPIYKELTAVLAAGVPEHVVIIDDARCFGRDEDYPEVGDLIRFVHARRPGALVVVEDDMIRITPR
jgi:hypothetical protein